MRLLLAIALVGVMATTTAQAAEEAGRLTLTDARRLLAEGDPAALHGAFQAHHAAYRSGTMAEASYLSPFHAFLVHDSRHVATIARWREAYPEDPAALTAYAALADKQAETFAEFRQPQLMSSDIAYQYTQLVQAAAERYAVVMREHPTWTFGPFRLQTAHAAATPMAMRRLVNRTLEEHGSPISHLRGALLSIPRDAEDLNDQVLGICEIEAPKIQGVALEECLAFGLASGSRSVLDHARFLAVLRADEEGHFLMHISAMLMRPGGEGALAEHLVQHDLPWPSWSLYAADVPNAEILLPHVRAALDHDREDPLLWAALAMHLASLGETEGIDEALDAANAAAPHSAYVTRATWRVIKSTGADHRVLPFAESMHRRFPNDFMAWYEPVLRMLREPEATSMSRHGRPHSDHACRHKRIFEAAKRSCDGESRDTPACTWVFSGHVDAGIAALDAPRCDGASGEATFRRPGEIGRRNVERAPSDRPIRRPAPSVNH